MNLGENGDSLDLEGPGLCQKAVLKSDLPIIARPGKDRL